MNENLDAIVDRAFSGLFLQSAKSAVAGMDRSRVATEVYEMSYRKSVDAEGSASGQGKAYFDIKSIGTTTITIRGGKVKMAGRGVVTVPDTEILPSGSIDDPGFIFLKVSAYGTLTASIEYSNTYPEDDGTYYRRALWEVYIDMDAFPYVGTKCDEFALRNPIGP